MALWESMSDLQRDRDSFLPGWSRKLEILWVNYFML